MDMKNPRNRLKWPHLRELLLSLTTVYVRLSKKQKRFTQKSNLQFSIHISHRYTLPYSIINEELIEEFVMNKCFKCFNVSHPHISGHLLLLCFFNISLLPQKSF